MSIVFQTFDFFILILAKDKDRWQEIKMKRPWFTMLGGFIILIVLTSYGTFYASRIPVGVTDNVWLFHWDGTGNFTTICTVQLNSAGLRGSTISWLDGIFNGWGPTYYGFGA